MRRRQLRLRFLLSERDIYLYYADNGSGDATSAFDYTAVPNNYEPIDVIRGNLGITEATFTLQQ